MAEARRVIPDIDFNGKSAKKSLDGLTEQIEYDDVASEPATRSPFRSSTKT